MSCVLMMTWLTISEHCLLKILHVTSAVLFSFLHLWTATLSSDVAEVLTATGSILFVMAFQRTSSRIELLERLCGLWCSKSFLPLG